MSRNSDDGLAIHVSTSKTSRLTKSADRGKLKIGDDWNAIRIIALSQSNPLKAIAEFVENSIGAHAKNVAITRGREHGEHYISIKDDGDGVPRDEEGRCEIATARTCMLPRSCSSWRGATILALK